MLINSRAGYHGFFLNLQNLNEAQAREACRFMCLNDLYFLLRYGLKRADMEHDWLFDRCREVQASPDNHLDLWARGHYKSTIITFGKTIQDILANPEITILIFSHINPIAKAFLIQIKNEFETNDTLKSWFPDVLYGNPKTESPKWSENDGIVVKRQSNPKECTVEASGLVDGQPISKHFQMIVYDDVVIDRSVTTPEQMEKTVRSLELSYNLGNDNPVYRFIGTRYHFNDAYKTLIERETAQPRIYAATEDGTTNSPPVFLSAENLLKKRKAMGVYTFSCQMLQNPVADSLQRFERSWLRFYDDLPQEINWYLLADAANGKRKENDYTAFWAVGLGNDGNYYCVPVCRDRLNLSERAKKFISLHRDYQPIECRYEEYGLAADIAYIELVQSQEQYRFDIVKVAGAMPKTDRIKRLQPLFEEGKIWFPRNFLYRNYKGEERDLVRDFLDEEFDRFPTPEHDDMLDCLSRICEQTGSIRDKKVELSLRFPKLVNRVFDKVKKWVNAYK